ncbi:ABC transporter ATP-binding protein [Bifidobacterium sp. W8101]|uniref:ABC transporter ATP-binding protein n=1 Tax=Bifidobacterium TaxID=1678 RepID=UPI0018DCF22E|nr:MULTISPECIES: ABC transporter ATP-binding protein [Bifidobacterium]MBI0126963.1 ABC transporter ATP-binding protein [Bifidobacterium choladohabitans]MBI0128532.1 ABC transporter ATP-binding protein [Bifidobacterium sp. W8103]MBI0139095.1 ABC transporter ATP-binding protein [Bifidobacterium sp. W8105]MBI0149459.1 ABC transporter ATP-binding protein [Bifidobacterium sp. W8107]
MAKDLSTNTGSQAVGGRRHTVGRLVHYLLASPWRVIVMVLAGMTAVAMIVIGPKVMGEATNVLFEGLLGSMLVKMGAKPGTPKQAVVTYLQSRGQDKFARMIDSMNVQVGVGIDWGRFGTILMFVIGIYLISILVRLVQNFLMTRLVSDAVYTMRRQIEDKLDRLPLQYFDRTPRGEVMSRTTNDIDNISGTLQQILGELLFSVFSIIGAFIMMLTISPLLTLIAFIIIPVMALCAGVILKKTQPQFTRQWIRTGQVNSHVEEMFSGHMVVRAFGHQREAEEEFEERNQELYQASFKASFFSALVTPMSTFFGNLSFVIVVIVGGVHVLNGSMSLGGLQAFTQYTRQASQPIGQLASMGTMLQSSLASCRRVFDFLDEAEEVPDIEHPDHLGQETGGKVEGHVRFDHVRFSYNPAEPLIKDLSIEAKPGQTIAIVGPTGAGKTTLVNLLMRFYEIQGGHITIDGVDTSRVTRHDLRSHFGMVLQDTWLFDGTVRDNLLYGLDEGQTIPEQTMINGAKATHVDEFIRKLPQGYDTVLNEDSSELSQGERQLMTICRAFLSDPDILILDEATSSVDTRTELLVQQAMNTLRKGRTSFVIAHRLSTIRDADLILVVNHGSVVEQGTHDQLLERGGAYASLYNSQFTKGEED